MENEKEKSIIKHKYFDSNFFKGLISIIVYIFIFYLGPKLLAITFMPLAINQSESFRQGFANFLIYITSFITLLFINKDTLKEDFKNIDDTSKFTTNILISVLVMYVAIFISGFIQSSIIKGVSENEQAINNIFKDNFAYIVMYPTTVILAPFVEEMVFRKSAFNVIKNKIVALIITTIIFGSMHIVTSYSMLRETYDATKAFLYTLAYGIPYFTMGFVFGSVYLTNDNNFYSSFILHLINNFVASSISMFILLYII